MNKKHANETIPAIVDLGDGKYEFCYNQSQEQQENHVDHNADYIVLDMPVDKQVVIQALIDKGHTEVEANQLTEGL